MCLDGDEEDAVFGRRRATRFRELAVVLDPDRGTGLLPMNAEIMSCPVRINVPDNDLEDARVVIVPLLLRCLIQYSTYVKADSHRRRP